MSHSATCALCGARPDDDRLIRRCPVCGGPLELPLVTSGAPRPGTGVRQSILDRYADFYPGLTDKTGVTLCEGMTPLLDAPGLADFVGAGAVLLKREDANPTWSFKDRGTYTALLHAISLGYRTVGTVSTGNMAASVAAYAARAGLNALILVSANTAPEKLRPIAMYGAQLLCVEGDYAELYRRSLTFGESVYFANSDVPYRVEGSKSIAFELCEQVGMAVPDFVIVPSSSGGNFRGIEKGFREFLACGLIQKMPRMVVAQAAACSPIAHAMAAGAAHVTRVTPGETVAHAMRNPHPPSGDRVLHLLRAHDGLAVAVTEEEILSAQRRLAREGVFAQPASAATLAVARRLAGEGVITRHSRVALIISGGGLKHTSMLERHTLSISRCGIDEVGDAIAAAVRKE